MSSTSQVTDFSDLVTDLVNRMRLATGVTATDTIVKRYLNIALHDMHLGFDYRVPWAERRAVLRTQDDYSTGTITATRGSTTLTGASTLWNTANSFGITNMRANGKIVVNGSRVPYKISAVSSDTAATLTTAYTETTAAAGSSYVYYEDEYDLATDFLRPVDIQQFSDAMEIVLISRTEARRRYTNNTVPGRPKVASIVDYAPSGNTTPIRRVQLFPPPNDYLLIPYSYVTSLLATSSAGVGQTSMSASSDEPIVPLRYRHAIVYHALYSWYRDRKDDQRSQEAKSEYNDIMLRISMDQDIGAPRPRLQPRIGSYVRAAKSPYRRGGGRFDKGGFDHMLD
jgi:hypothetical protein